MISHLLAIVRVYRTSKHRLVSAVANARRTTPLRYYRSSSTVAFQRNLPINYQARSLAVECEPTDAETTRR